jgi:hypothetical protein
VIKSAFRPSELWHPQNSKQHEEWKEFKERRRREREFFKREETLWQKVVRIITGDSPLRSRLTESNKGAHVS